MCLKLILHNIKENGVARTKKTKIIVRRNVTMFLRNFSKHVNSMIRMHAMYVNTILQKIRTKQR